MTNKSCVNCEFYERQDMIAYDEERKGFKKIKTKRTITTHTCFSGPTPVWLGTRITRPCVNHLLKHQSTGIERKLIAKFEERNQVMEPIGACSYKYESAQFCGGPWYQTSCGKITRDMNEFCEFCGKPTVEVNEL